MQRQRDPDPRPSSHTGKPPCAVTKGRWPHTEFQSLGHGLFGAGAGQEQAEKKEPGLWICLHGNLTSGFWFSKWGEDLAAEALGGGTTQCHCWRGPVAPLHSPTRSAQ